VIINKTYYRTPEDLDGGAIEYNVFATEDSGFKRRFGGQVRSDPKIRYVHGMLAFHSYVHPFRTLHGLAHLYEHLAVELLRDVVDEYCRENNIKNIFYVNAYTSRYRVMFVLQTTKIHSKYFNFNSDPLIAGYIADILNQFLSMLACLSIDTIRHNDDPNYEYKYKRVRDVFVNSLSNEKSAIINEISSIVAHDWMTDEIIDSYVSGEIIDITGEAENVEQFTLENVLLFNTMLLELSNIFINLSVDNAGNIVEYTENKVVRGKDGSTTTFEEIIINSIMHNQAIEASKSAAGDRNDLNVLQKYYNDILVTPNKIAIKLTANPIKLADDTVFEEVHYTKFIKDKRDDKKLGEFRLIIGGNPTPEDHILRNNHWDNPNYPLIEYDKELIKKELRKMLMEEILIWNLLFSNVIHAPGLSELRTKNELVYGFKVKTNIDGRIFYNCAAYPVFSVEFMGGENTSEDNAALMVESVKLINNIRSLLENLSEEALLTLNNDIEVEVYHTVYQYLAACMEFGVDYEDFIQSVSGKNNITVKTILDELLVDGFKLYTRFIYIDGIEYKKL